MTERAQTLREEIANALSHGLGFLLAVASLPVLMRKTRYFCGSGESSQSICASRARRSCTNT